MLNEAEQSEGSCNNWSVAQWQNFATKILNSEEPAIKNFLDELEQNNPGAKAAISASIASYRVSAVLAARIAAAAAATAAEAAALFASRLFGSFAVCFTCRITITIHFPQGPA